jgi:hypothetical protein
MLGLNAMKKSNVKQMPAQSLTEKYIVGIKELRKEVTSSPKKAREFLIKAGIYTKKGNLTKGYK